MPFHKTTFDKKTRQEWETEAQQLFTRGQFFLAYDLAKAGSEVHEESLVLKKIAALSASKTGALDEARRIIEPIIATVEIDAEIAGAFGSVYKRLWQGDGRIEHIQMAREIYRRAYEHSGNFYNGINAATTAWLLGDHKEAQAIANKILRAMRAVTPPEFSPAERYWYEATIGEALLLLGRSDEAVSSYLHAVEHGEKKYQRINSSYQQIKLLDQVGMLIPLQIHEILRPPTVVTFTGHMLDRPDRPVQRFPPQLEPSLRVAIDTTLTEMDAQIAYCSAACGADLIFLEAMSDRGGEVNIVLPFRQDDFLAQSVSFAGPEWIARFHRALEKADTVSYVTEERYLSTDELFQFGTTVMTGQARLRARAFLTEPHLLAVWDGLDTGLPGGTSCIISEWTDKERLHVIRTDHLVKMVPKPSIHAKKKTSLCKAASEKNTEAYQRVIRVMMFADISGFSKLQDENALPFIGEILHSCGKRLDVLPGRPPYINTWGDAIFAVTERAIDLMRFATVLRDFFSCTDLKTFNLPPGLNVRIALHAGPVFSGEDPITHRSNYYGSNVNRAARIEPVTVPGCIYASEQFVALLTEEQHAANNFTYVCEFIGTIALAKNFGSQAVYLVKETGK